MVKLALMVQLNKIITSLNGSIAEAGDNAIKGQEKGKGVV